LKTKLQQKRESTQRI